MVATRTSTQSLPEKQPTFADLQATLSQVKPTSKTKNATRAKITKKRALPDDTIPVFKDADPTPPRKVRNTAISKTATASKDAGASIKTGKRDSTKVASPVLACNESIPPAKGQRAASVNAILQQFPVPVTQMATTNPQRFNPGAQTTFLSLPAEIRNEIYLLALIEDEPVRVRTVDPYLLEPGLLATNKQVRSEALGIWYGENLFEIDGSSPAVKFLRATSDNKLRALRCLRILTTFIPADDYIKTRIEQLLREFQPRGLDRQAIHFMMSVPNGFEWVNLAKLRKTSKVQKAKGG